MIGEVAFSCKEFLALPTYGGDRFVLFIMRKWLVFKRCAMSCALEPVSIGYQGERESSKMRLIQFLKKQLPQTLYRRSLLIVVMPIVLIQAISAFVFFDRHLESVTRQVAIFKAEEIATIVSLARHMPKFVELIQHEAAHCELALTRLPANVLPASQAIPFSSAAGVMFDEALQGRLTDAYLLTESKHHFLVHVVSGRETLEFSVPKRRFTSRTSDIFIMWSLGTSSLFTLIAWLFMRNQIRPIKKLAQAAEQFGRDSAFDPLVPSGALEVRKAGEAFNVMQARIKRYIEQRTEMLAGVSHDLRTPLTRMRLHLELMPENTSVLALKHDLAEMDTMVTHFLEYVRGERLETMERVALAPVIREVARRYFMPELCCTFALDDRIVSTVRPQAFRRLVANIISNCQRYAHNVHIRLVQQEDIELRIEDDGPGIPEHHRQNVFRPFFRLDASRTP
ncbi:MAG: HAMP domain-containing protein, partial [Holosporales bacterium]|nr:HAMP domain-containing protein [Holosporales bacterium]